MIATARERFHGADVSGYIDAAVSAGQGKALAQYDPLAQDDRLSELIVEIWWQKETGSFPEHIRPLIAEREVLAAPATGEITVDGAAEEPAWEDAQAVEFFVTGEDRRLARWPTRVRLLWDEAALYLHAEMLEDDGVEPKNRAAGVWGIVRKDDWIEVLLTPEIGAPVRNLLLQAGGMPQFRLGEGDRQRWPSEIASEAVTGPGLWTAEMRLPFSELEMAPQVGEQWGINVLRHRAAKTDSPGSEDSRLTPEGAFVPLRLVDESADQDTEVRFALEQVGRGDQTVEHGFATILTLLPWIETNRQSRDVSVRMQVRADGETLAEYERDLRQLPGLWSAAGPIQMDLGQAFDGDLTVTMSVSAGDGSVDASQQFTIDERGRATAR
jgi:hypothetical protein